MNELIQQTKFSVSNSVRMTMSQSRLNRVNLLRELKLFYVVHDLQLIKKNV